MPNKTIYISDNDLPLADRAAELAGGLSPAVMEGLKLYLRNTEAAERGFEEVHVVDRTDGVETRKIFQGRQLARLSQSLEGKRVEWTSYLTPKENIAVVRSEHPDFVAVARGAGAAGPNAGRGTSTFGNTDATTGSSRSNSTGRPRNPEEITNDVLDFARRTFGEATGRGNRAAQRPKLDIDLSYWMNSANQIFNDLTGGFERGMSRPAEFNDGDDSGTNRSAKGFGGAVDHRNSAGQTTESSSSTGSSSDRSGSDQLGSDRPGSDQLGSDRPSSEDSGSEGPSAEGPRPASHGKGNQRAEDEGHADSTIVRDAWAAHHELEVFEDLEQLKEAAFRHTKTVPAPFISATERALSTPKTEYLDI